MLRKKKLSEATACRSIASAILDNIGLLSDRDLRERLLTDVRLVHSRAISLSPMAEPSDEIRQAYYKLFREGIRVFNRGIDDKQAYDEAALLFRTAADLGASADIEGYSEALVNLAFSLLNANREVEAITPLERALELGDTQIETFMFLADQYLKRDETARAIDILRRASTRHPNDTNIQSQLLNAYVKAGRIDEAMQLYRTAVQGEPENKLYRYNLGSLLLKTEEYKEAIEHLARAVEIDPAYANAQYNLGAAYVNLAVELNEQISTLDDEIREQRDSLSDTEIGEREQEIENLAEERRDLFAQAVPPLEKAKTLMESEDDADVTAVCQALHAAYTYTDQLQKAREVAWCAGYDASARAVSPETQSELNRN